MKMKPNKQATLPSREPTMIPITLRETTKPLEDSELQIEIVCISLIHVCHDLSLSRALSGYLRSFSA